MTSEVVLEDQLSSLLYEHNSISPHLSPHPFYFELSSAILLEALKSIYGASLSKDERKNLSFKDPEWNDKIVNICEKVNECSTCKSQLKNYKEKRIFAHTSVKCFEHRISLLGLKVACENCFQVINLDRLVQISSNVISHPSPQNTNQLSQLLKHYLQVNNLTLNESYNFQDAISTGFAIRILMKQINWSYECPHRTLNDFLKSLELERESSKFKIFGKSP